MAYKDTVSTSSLSQGIDITQVASLSNISTIQGIYQLPDGTLYAVDSAGGKVRVGDSFRPYAVPRLAQLTNRCYAPDTSTAGGSYKQGMFLRTMRACSPMYGSIQFLYPNVWLINNGSSTSSVNTLTIQASVEYPIGSTPKMMTFNGSTTGTILDATVGIGLIDLTIPKGDYFIVRTWVSAPTAIPYTTTPHSSPYIDGGIISATTTPNLTTGGAVSWSTPFNYGPLAVVGLSQDRAVLILGDSINRSQSSDPDYTGLSSYIEKAIGLEIPYINLSMSGTQATQLVSAFNASNSPNFFNLFPYFDTVIIAVGTNDIFTGLRTAAQLQADITSLTNTQFSGKGCFICTVLPQSTSTDSFITTVNQTTKAQNSVRNTFNATVRSGPYAISAQQRSGFFDVTKTVESAFDSGVFLAPPAITPDGTHLLVAGHHLIAQSGAIDIKLIKA